MCNAWNHPPYCMCGWGGGWNNHGLFDFSNPKKTWWNQLENLSVHEIENNTRINSEFNVNETDIRNYTALIWAAINGKLEESKFLISIGANVDLTDVFGQTALYFSTVNKFENISNLLLPISIDKSQHCNALKMRNSEYRYQLEKEITNSITNQDAPSLLILLEEWNKNNFKFQGLIPAIEIVKKRNIELLKILIKFDIDISHCDDRGMNPLMHAAISGDIDIINLLLKTKINPNSYDKYKRNAIYFANANNQKEALSILISNNM